MSQPMTYWSITSQLLIEEAQELGLAVEILCREKNLFAIKGHGKEIIFKSNDFGGNSSLSKKIVDDKELSHIMLERWGFPIPRTAYVDRESLIQFDYAIFHTWKYPLVIKPIDEGHGNGVMMGIRDITELGEKLAISLDKYHRMIVQEQIDGDECRVIVMFGKVVLAINRIPPRIIGDGRTSVIYLIEHENSSNPLRGEGYDKGLSKILIDNELMEFISKQGKTLESVLISGEELQLRGNSNIGTGGTIRDITHILHDDIRKITQSIALKLDMDLLCLDIISKDFSRPLSETGGVILELGGNPGFGGDRELTSVNTAKFLLQKLFNL